MVVAGPSGSGKSRLCSRLHDALGVLTVNLDDFYKNGDDPTLPRLHLAPGQDIVDWDDPASWSCEDRGLLAAAYCVRQHPVVTFWRRLTRDLREHRKPPLVLLRRGYALLRDQRRVVADAVGKGCTPVTPDEAFHQVTDLVEVD